MTHRFRRGLHYLLAAGLVALVSAPLFAAEQEPEPAFKYVGGTEILRAGCEGNLETSSTDMTFRCRSDAITIPYSSIAFMEYRSDLSRKVRRLKPKWKVRPEIWTPLFGRKRNRYFTVVFRAAETTRVVVLGVKSEDMRPYLAEIDLKSGIRIETQGYEKY